MFNCSELLAVNSFSNPEFPFEENENKFFLDKLLTSCDMKNKSIYFIIFSNRNKYFKNEIKK